MHVEAERFTFGAELADDAGDIALEVDRDDAGVRDLDDMDVVERAGDDDRADDDRDDVFLRDSLDTIGCTALGAPGFGPRVDRRRFLVAGEAGELAGSSMSSSKGAETSAQGLVSSVLEAAYRSRSVST